MIETTVLDFKLSNTLVGILCDHMNAPEQQAMFALMEPFYIYSR